MSAVLETKRGTITYAEEYIATIAGLSATECYGIIGMASAKKVTDNINDLLRRENIRKGVKIFTDDTNVLRIELYVIVEYGVSISAVASTIIETVRYNVEKATGLLVKDVHIRVSGIRVQ